MKKLILFIMILYSTVSMAQKTVGQNYTYIGQRYEWLAGVFQALGLPAGPGPAAFTAGQEPRAGAVYYDSTGAEAGLYIFNGLTWELVGSGASQWITDGAAIYYPGNVGIGSTPSYLFHVKDAAGNNYMAADSVTRQSFMQNWDAGFTFNTGVSVDGINRVVDLYADSIKITDLFSNADLGLKMVLWNPIGKSLYYRDVPSTAVRFGVTGEDISASANRAFDLGTRTFTLSGGTNSGWYFLSTNTGTNDRGLNYTQNLSNIFGNEADASTTNAKLTTSTNPGGTHDAQTQLITSNSDSYSNELKQTITNASAVTQIASTHPTQGHRIDVYGNKINMFATTGTMNLNLTTLPNKTSMLSTDSLLLNDNTGKVHKISKLDFSSSAIWNGNVSGTSFSATSSSVTSSAVQWTFTGSVPETFTLPPRTSSVNQFYFFKNIGSADLTIAADGTDDIYTSSSVPNVILAPKESILITGAASGTSDLWTALFHSGNIKASEGLTMSNDTVQLGGNLTTDRIISYKNGSKVLTFRGASNDGVDLNFSSTDSLSNPDDGSNDNIAAFASTKIWKIPSYTSTTYRLGNHFGLEYQIQDSVRINSFGGDFGMATQNITVFSKMAGYSGRSVYVIGNQTRDDNLPITLNNLDWIGTSTAGTNYKYVRGWVVGNQSYIIGRANDTLENYAGYNVMGYFPSGHFKWTADYMGGYNGSASSARVAKNWFLYNWGPSSSYIRGPIGLGDSVIAANAMLDIKSTTKGVYLTRMTTTQRTSISSPAAGLIVFDTDLSSYFQYTGSAWQNLYNVGGDVTKVGTPANNQVGIWTGDGTIEGVNSVQYNGTTFGIGGTMDASAILDLTSTSQGFLNTRMNTTQQNAIASPATGLMIYNTDSSLFRYYNGLAWVSISAGSGGSGGVWGTITGTLSSQTDLQSALDAKINETTSSPAHTATNATGTGIMGVTFPAIVNSDFTMSNTNTAQNALPTSMDVITVQGNTTYKVKIHYKITSGGTSHSTGISFSLGGGASVTRILGVAFGRQSTTGSGTALETDINTVSNTIVTAAAAAGQHNIFFEGWIVMNAGGTITPQITFSADPTGTILMKAGSSIEITPVGDGSFTNSSIFN